AARPPRFGGLDRPGKDSGGLAVGAARRDQPVDRSKEIRMLELAGNAHAVGQIEMAQPADINAVDGHDRLGIGDAKGGLDQGYDERAVVGLAQLLHDIAAAIIVMRHAEGDPAYSFRAVSTPGCYLLRL